MRSTQAAAVALAAAMAASIAVGTEAACRKEAVTTVCSSAAGVYRVIDDSTSPDGRFAFAWTFKKSTPPSKRELWDSDSDGRKMAVEGRGVVENALVRLPDGAVMGRSRGNHVGDAQFHNHNKLLIYWSAKGSHVLEIHQSKWESPVADAWRIDSADRVTGPARIADVARKAAEAEMRRRAKRPKALKLKDYKYAVSAIGDADSKPTVAPIDDTGHVEVDVVAEVPKSEASESFQFRMGISVAADRTGQLVARVTSIRLTQQD